jgi:hypothetical protein
LRADLLLVLAYFVMPHFAEGTIDEQTRQAMEMTIRSRADYWVTQAAARIMKEFPDSALTSELDTESGSTPSLSAVVTNDEADRRRALVEAYIDREFKRTGKRITRTAIWKSVGYRSRTEFERWERNDKRATKTAHDRFMRLLENKPPLK